jgi:hypothetical protein
MSEVYCIVEGHAEQAFIRHVLAPYLAERGCFIYAWILGKPGHKGGDVTYERFTNDVHRCLRTRNDVYITSMFDYFRLDVNWPGIRELHHNIDSGKALSPFEILSTLSEYTKTALSQRFPDHSLARRFIPYFSIHEYEALLFSDINIFSKHLHGGLQQLNDILLAHHNNPELINTRPELAPSKRIQRIYPQYKKIQHGNTIAQEIGIPTISSMCRCFNTWVTSLLSLESTNP